MGNIIPVIKMLPKFKDIKDIEVSFDYLRKGRFTYKGEYKGERLVCCGGESSFAEAFYLELRSKEIVGELLLEEHTDIYEKDGTIYVEEV